jgi:hypothetical protein
MAAPPGSKTITTPKTKDVTALRRRTQGPSSSLAALRFGRDDKGAGRFLRAHQRTNLLSQHNFPDVPALVKLENDDGQIVVLAQRDGG